MTYLGSAGAVIATWIGRANQAWGASRVWNSGISWETDRNNWYNQANAWYTSRYNEGYSAGYAQADLVESPRAWSQSIFTVGAQGGSGASNFIGLNLTPSSDPLGVWAGNNTVRLRTGYWSIRVSGRFNGSGTARFRILQSGSPIRTSQAGPDATNPGDCQETVAPSASTDYTFQMAADGAVSLVAGGTVVVTFIPVPATPQ